MLKCAPSALLSTWITIHFRGSLNICIRQMRFGSAVLRSRTRINDRDRCQIFGAGIKSEILGPASGCIVGRVRTRSRNKPDFFFPSALYFLLDFLFFLSLGSSTERQPSHRARRLTPTRFKYLATIFFLFRNLLQKAAPLRWATLTSSDVLSVLHCTPVIND